MRMVVNSIILSVALGSSVQLLVSECIQTFIDLTRARAAGYVTVDPISTYHSFIDLDD
jgi:hypothetical protein